MRSGTLNRLSIAREADRPRTGRRRGFTLAETLAALLFLAIVIPVIIQGLQLASYAGVVSQRKAVAVRIGESILNEMVATGTWQGGTGSGSVQEGPLEFRWQTKVESWPEGQLRQLSILVFFPVQGREQRVRLTTLVDTALP